MEMQSETLPRIGISSCLLGEEVRHDGGHKRDAYLVGILGEMVAWVPACPEVEFGLGTPREPIRLIRNKNDPSVVRLLSRSGLEITARMQRFTRRRVRELAKENLSGYIVKKDSPSCGMERVKIWKDEKRGGSERNGQGVFTAELIRQFPNLPVEEEGRLHDSQLLENVRTMDF